MLHLVLFFIFAIVCVGGAVNLLLQRHPINSALSLIVVMGSLAVLYLLLGAEFVAAIQIIVYAGAVMVLFVFVIMLLNLKEEELGEQRITLWKGIGALSVVALVGLIAFFALRHAYTGRVRDLAVEQLATGFGTVKAVGRTLYLFSVLPFEVTSLLLTVAIVGAVVVAKGKI
jgi:NADH-quinone oxidoreductase subunit J